MSFQVPFLVMAMAEGVRLPCIILTSPWRKLRASASWSRPYWISIGWISYSCRGSLQHSYEGGVAIVKCCRIPRGNKLLSSAIKIWPCSHWDFRGLCICIGILNLLPSIYKATCTCTCVHVHVLILWPRPLCTHARTGLVILCTTSCPKFRNVAWPIRSLHL